MNALLETFSCVYSEIMSNIISFFQKLIKGGIGIRAGGWKIFQKLISGGGGRLFGTREYVDMKFRPSLRLIVFFGANDDRLM